MASRLITPVLEERLKSYPLYSQDGKGKDAVCVAIFFIGHVRWFVLEGQPEDVWEQTKEVNDSAATSPLLGFSFDVEPVQQEVTNVSTVVKQYESLVGGELPVEETNAEFVDQLKTAGIDTVLEEMQRQVDEFLASK